LHTSQPLPRGAHDCRPIRRSAIAAGTRLPVRILGGLPSWARRPSQAALNSSSVPRAPRCLPRSPNGRSFGSSTSAAPDHPSTTALPAGDYRTGYWMLGVFAQPPSCRAPHERGYAKNPRVEYCDTLEKARATGNTQQTYTPEASSLLDPESGKAPSCHVALSSGMRHSTVAKCHERHSTPRLH